MKTAGETFQEEQAVKEGMMRHLLAALDPQEGDDHLDYLGLLKRLREALAVEIALSVLYDILRRDHDGVL